MRALKEMVASECANFRRGGRCLFGDGCVAYSGKRCSLFLDARMQPSTEDHFARCVAPLARTEPKYVDAAIEYAHNCNAKAPEVRNCTCGAPLAKKRRLCDRCSKKANSEHQRQHRLKRKALTTFSSSQPV